MLSREMLNDGEIITSYGRKGAFQNLRLRLCPVTWVAAQFPVRRERGMVALPSGLEPDQSSGMTAAMGAVECRSTRLYAYSERRCKRAIGAVEAGSLTR